MTIYSLGVISCVGNANKAVLIHEVNQLYCIATTYLCPMQVIPGENEGNVVVYKARRSVVRMVMVTLIVFFVAWTPYNVLYLLKRLEVDYRSVYS